MYTPFDSRRSAVCLSFASTVTARLALADRFPMRSLDPLPALLVELPVLGREQVEQQAIVWPPFDDVTLPLPADEAEVEALQASKRRVAVHDPGVDRAKPEVPERKGQELG